MKHRLKCTIVKPNSCDHHDKEHEDDEGVVVESRIATPHGEHKVKFDLPYEQTANALMPAKGYSEYTKKHGYHFTDVLAGHVSKMVENANDPDGYEGMIFCIWTADAIGKAVSINWEKFVWLC